MAASKQLSERSGATIRPPRASHMRQCSIPKCNRKHKSRGWCKPHYARWLRYGDPTAGYRPVGAAQAWLLKHVSHTGKRCLIWPFGLTWKRLPSDVTLNGVREAAHRAMCRLAMVTPIPAPKP